MKWRLKRVTSTQISILLATIQQTALTLIHFKVRSKRTTVQCDKTQQSDLFTFFTHVRKQNSRKTRGGINCDIRTVHVDGGHRLILPSLGQDPKLRALHAQIRGRSPQLVSRSNESDKQTHVDVEQIDDGPIDTAHIEPALLHQR